MLINHLREKLADNGTSLLHTLQSMDETGMMCVCKCSDDSRITIVTSSAVQCSPNGIPLTPEQTDHDTVPVDYTKLLAFA